MIGGLERIAVTIRWAYFRTAGLLPTRSPLVPSRLRRTRDLVERAERVEIDARTFVVEVTRWSARITPTAGCAAALCLAAVLDDVVPFGNHEGRLCRRWAGRGRCGDEDRLRPVIPAG